MADIVWAKMELSAFASIFSAPARETSFQVSIRRQGVRPRLLQGEGVT